MSTAVLYRETRSGTIELNVSDRTAVRTEVARADEWAREFRPRTVSEWAAKLKGMNRAERRRERRRREREAPMTDVSPNRDLEPTPGERTDPEAIEARREKLDNGASRPLPGRDERPYPNAGAFYLLSVRDNAARNRGTPANTAPGAPYSEARVDV